MPPVVSTAESAGELLAIRLEVRMDLEILQLVKQLTRTMSMVLV